MVLIKRFPHATKTERSCRAFDNSYCQSQRVWGVNNKEIQQSSTMELSIVEISSECSHLNGMAVRLDHQSKHVGHVFVFHGFQQFRADLFKLWEHSFNDLI